MCPQPKHTVMPPPAHHAHALQIDVGWSRQPAAGSTERYTPGNVMCRRQLAGVPGTAASGPASSGQEW